MCARYPLTSPEDVLKDHFDYQNSGFDYPPLYNIAPTQPIHIIRLDLKKKPELTLVRWGLIPGWVKEPDNFSTLINARAETINEKPSFKTSMKYHRCLIPADGFYEWTGKKGEKRPYMMRRKKDPKSNAGSLIAFAGIWAGWMGADGSEMDSAAIITVQANTEVSYVHHRMPAILEPDQFENWLDPNALNATQAAELLRPAPDDTFDVFEINKAVNNYRNKGADVQEPLQGLLF